MVHNKPVSITTFPGAMTYMYETYDASSSGARFIKILKLHFCSIVSNWVKINETTVGWTSSSLCYNMISASITTCKQHRHKNKKPYRVINYQYSKHAYLWKLTVLTILNTIWWHILVISISLTVVEGGNNGIK